MLHEVIAQDNLEVIRYILNLNIDVNLKNNRGKTPMLLACQHNNTEIEKLELLLEYDANIAIIASSDENVPHFAISRCKTDVIDFIISNFANIFSFQTTEYSCLFSFKKLD